MSKSLYARRLLQHLWGLLHTKPERASAAAGILLGDQCDWNAPVHRCLHKSCDGAALIKEGAVGEIQ